MRRATKRPMSAAATALDMGSHSLNRQMIYAIVLIALILAAVTLAKSSGDRLALSDQATETDSAPDLLANKETPGSNAASSGETGKEPATEQTAKPVGSVPCIAEQLPQQVGYYQIATIGEDNIEGNLPARTDADRQAKVTLALPHGTSNIYVTGACRAAPDGSAWWEIDLDPGLAFLEAKHLAPMSGETMVCPPAKTSKPNSSRMKLTADIDGDEADDYITLWKEESSGWQTQVEYGDGFIGTRKLSFLDTTFSTIDKVGSVELPIIGREIVIVQGTRTDGSSTYALLESLETSSECGLRLLSRPNSGTVQPVTVEASRQKGLVNDLRCKKVGRGVRELNIWSAIWTASGWQTATIPLLPSQVNGELIAGTPKGAALHGKKNSPPIPTYSSCI